MTREDSNSSVGSLKKTVTFAVAEVLCYDPPISCEECGMEFPSNSLLRDHQERSHQREWVKCLICVKTVKHREHFVI